MFRIFIVIDNRVTLFHKSQNVSKRTETSKQLTNKDIHVLAANTLNCVICETGFHWCIPHKRKQYDQWL